VGGPHFLPADLTSVLPAAVLSRHPEFRTDQPSVVIAEGLTMYFDAPRVLELLGSFAWIAGPGGRVIFSFMEAADDGSIGFRGESRAVGLWLRLRREPFRWGCARADLPDFLSAAGLKLDRTAGHHDLRRDILVPRGAGDLPLARGECLCLCHPSP
jgi:O-methyltransferase involved in polyketide biosynthesis